MFLLTTIVTALDLAPLLFGKESNTHKKPPPPQSLLTDAQLDVTLGTRPKRPMTSFVVGKGRITELR